MVSNMTGRIDTVLDKVKEPETRMSVAQLGLVRKLRYSESQKRLLIFTNPVKPSPPCCSIVAGLLHRKTTQSLVDGFQKEFPDFSIEMIGPLPD